jgi:hypothetical protein
LPILIVVPGSPMPRFTFVPAAPVTSIGPPLAESGVPSVGLVPPPVPGAGAYALVVGLPPMVPSMPEPSTGDGPQENTPISGGSG